MQWIHLFFVLLFVCPYILANEKFPIFESDKHFIRSENSAHPFPPHLEGSEVGLLTQGQDSFAARVELLRKAKKSIRVQALIFTGDESGLYLANLLKQKKSEGLNVRVIVDSLSNLEVASNLINKTKLKAQTQKMYFDLLRNGIEVDGFFWLQWTTEFSFTRPEVINKRYHDKLWIIDAETENAEAIVGGLNIANEYFRLETNPRLIWRDQDVLVRGLVVKDMASAFDRNYQYLIELKDNLPGVFNPTRFWNKIKDYASKYSPNKWDLRPEVLKLIDFALEQPNTVQTKPAKIRFIHSRPRFGETYIHQAYLEMIRSAQNEILIANAYFIPRGELARALIDAVKRGVRVTLLTNSVETNDLPDLTLVARYYYRSLLEANHLPDSMSHWHPPLELPMQIYEWHGERHGEGTLHAKYAVFDRQAAIVGSYNLDPRSELLNSETIVVFESPDLATELANQFIYHDLQKSEQISWEDAIRFHHPEKASEKFRLLFSIKFSDWM